MDERRFDDATKALVGEMKPRRAALRLLAGSGLGVLAARFKSVDVAEAKNNNKDKHKNKKKDKDKKRKKPPPECSSDSDCAGCERCIGGECAMGLVAPCDASRCQEPVCMVATNSWECRRTCQHADAVCCKGTCFSPCSNGCEINDSCDACNKPPAGKEYCAFGDRCITGCPPGLHFNPHTCLCEVCGHRCDPETGAWSQVGCAAGEQCYRGSCRHFCPPQFHPDATQLCCGGPLPPDNTPDCVCIAPSATCGGRCSP